MFLLTPLLVYAYLSGPTTESALQTHPIVCASVPFPLQRYKATTLSVLVLNTTPVSPQPASLSRTRSCEMVWLTRACYVDACCGVNCGCRLCRLLVSVAKALRLQNDQRPVHTIQEVMLNAFERVPPIINLWVSVGTSQALNNA